MARDNYDLLISELDKIAEKVTLFPETLQESVYNLVVKSLLDTDPRDLEAIDVVSETEIGDISSGEEVAETEARNIASEVIDYYERFSLAKCNDMEFATFVVYYFTVLAPNDKRVETVGEAHYTELCKITGRQLPKRVSGALNNAKNVRGYLEREGTGIYSLSNLGEHFVVHTLLKEKE